MLLNMWLVKTFMWKLGDECIHNELKKALDYKEKLTKLDKYLCFAI
jgi:hypothetical protein